MSRVPRRSLLERAAIGISSLSVVGTAGCLDTGRRERGANTDTSTRAGTTNASDGATRTTTASSTTPATSDDRTSDALAADARFLEQPSADSPPILELSLVNDSDRTVSVEPYRAGGLPLEYWKPTRELVFVPAEPEHVFLRNDEQRSITPTRGCWRFPDEAEVVYEDMAFPARLSPGDAYRIRHEVYDNVGRTDCFSFEPVEFVKTVVVSDGETEPYGVSFTYRLSVSDNVLGVEIVD